MRAEMRVETRVAMTTVLMVERRVVMLAMLVLRRVAMWVVKSEQRTVDTLCDSHNR